MLHTVQLGQAATRIHERDAEVLVLGPGGAERARWLARLVRAPFPVAADPGREVFRAYGYARRVVSMIQQSGTVVVDRAGVVRLVRRATNPLGALDLPELERALDRLKGDS